MKLFTGDSVVVELVNVSLIIKTELWFENLKTRKTFSVES